MTERKERNKLFLQTTLKVSKILDNECSNCPFKDGDKNRIKCLECPFYKELRNLGTELESLTAHKIHKESWESDRGQKADCYTERLYKYEKLSDLEKDLEVENLKYLRENHSLVSIAEMLDCEYKILRSFVNKYKLNKREDGTFYKNK